MFACQEQWADFLTGESTTKFGDFIQFMKVRWSTNSQFASPTLQLTGAADEEGEGDEGEDVQEEAPVVSVVVKNPAAVSSSKPPTKSSARRRRLQNLRQPRLRHPGS